MSDRPDRGAAPPVRKFFIAGDLGGLELDAVLDGGLGEFGGPTETAPAGSQDSPEPDSTRCHSGDQA